jgi:hypothetical protein
MAWRVMMPKKISTMFSHDPARGADRRTPPSQPPATRHTVQCAERPEVG